MKAIRENRRAILLGVFLISCLTAYSETLSIDIDGKQWYGSNGVKFSYPHGVYTDAIQIEMKSDNGGIIHYSLDGNTPTIDSPVYKTPLQIEKTTIIRASEEVGGALSSTYSTATYIYPVSVIKQPNEIEGYPKKWGPYATIADTAIADYGMDPELVNNSSRCQKVINSFSDLPIVSLVTDISNFFNKSEDPETGGIYIYTGAPVGSGIGRGWERPVSVELFGGPQNHDLATTCAIRIHGGHSRIPEKNPKHSFRLKFKSAYGPSKLKYPVFEGDDEEAEYNSLVLRCFFNNSWTCWDKSASRAQYTRDMCARMIQRNLGWEYVKGLYAHVFINGLYWGVYCVSEHIDEHFAKNHYGGKKSDYDVLKVEELEDYAVTASSGDLVAYNELLFLCDNADQNENYYRIQGKDPTGNINPTIEPLLNIDSFIDYMLINQYAGNSDWDFHNWNAVRKRGGDGFHFICWDAENIFEELNYNNLSRNNDKCPSNIFQGLMKNEKFRHKYSERALDLLGSEGILSETKVVEVWDSLFCLIENAIYAEAARWGDYRYIVHSYGGVYLPVFSAEESFMEERNRLLFDYFPYRSTVFRSQLEEKGWLSNTTGIQMYRTDVSNSLVYDLSGRQLNNTKPGTNRIVIRNGRKETIR